MLDLGVQVEQASSGFLMIYSLSYTDGNAPGADIVQLADYAVRNVNNEILRVPGVGKIQFLPLKPPCEFGLIHKSYWLTTYLLRMLIMPLVHKIFRLPPAALVAALR